MKRTLVDLDESDLGQLDELAKSLNTSRASILREAVAEYLIRHDRPVAAAPKPLAGFGSLKGHYGDGVAYQDHMRSEWD